jgi:hypothetical protein
LWLLDLNDGVLTSQAEAEQRQETDEKPLGSHKEKLYYYGQKSPL